MAYRWATFTNRHPILGFGCEVFVIILSIVSVSLPLISESLSAIGVSACLTTLCFILFSLFLRSDKLRRNIHG
ncbi:hypothetical protein CWN88_13500 [Vibrio splendidus]|nr:hypothetical protein CWN82_13745 [Vibrio splendidus]PTO66161.1 hypothetical protein CWN99_07585 [Vibrio splendidus]PTP00834.1 hypothetical protein CWN88_13500 [Vibrio splendidus]PTP38858.1 hypothetical protein CWN87_23555 [Vibrio splendidus]PTQ05426.1 hypothetical protein CWO28_12955 [Vibrio splendidus]